MNSASPVVGVVMGSASDWETMKAATDILAEFAIPFDAQVVSAHRMPDEMFAYAEGAAARGLQAIIAGAGGAAHLPGMLAAKTVVPVLGVPVAYALSVYPVKHWRDGLFFFISTKMLPIVAVIGPLYVIALHVHLLDSIWVLIILYTAMNLPLAIWLIRSFMLEVPGELLEAARLDGAGRPREITEVIMPVISPGLVSTALVTEASPAASPSIIFTALTAVALAGVSLAGGRGSLPRVAVGALILATISNGLTIKGIDPYWGTGLTGVLLLGSLALEKWVSTTVSNRLVSTAQASVHTGTR